MDHFASELGSDTIYTVSAKAVSRVLESGSPDAARLLLYIMETRDRFVQAEAQKALHMNAGRIAAALAVIRGQADETPEQLTLEDILSVPQAASSKPAPAAIRPDSPPSYTRAELAGAMADADFSYLCSKAEQALGHPLRQYEMNTLMTIYDYLCLPASVIAMLIHHVRQNADHRSTPDHPCSVSFRDIRAEAARWYEHGINTVAAAERYIEAENLRNSAMGRVFRLLGIRDREPSPTERRYVEQFLELDPTTELIALAYDRTVLKKGFLEWPYMRGILQNWHKKGYATPADVDANDRTRQKGENGQPAGPTEGYDERVLGFLDEQN